MSVKGAAVKRLFFVYIGQQTTDNGQQTTDNRLWVQSSKLRAQSSKKNHFPLDK